MSCNMKLLKHSCLLLSFLLVSAGLAFAQDEKPPKTSFGGYVKYMQTWDFTNGFDSLLDNHLIHNRLNFSWFPNTQWTFRMEARNRIFFGDYVQQIPVYKEFIDVNNDQLDLSTWAIDGGDVLMLSEIDRAYVQYTKDNWEFTAGRQRINWGISTVWNPNDIFNAYSFFDFDYEERPGSDAVSINYYYGFASKISFASKLPRDTDDHTAALLWKINKGGYDFQFLTGFMQNNYVVGTGWAGNIKTAGFKGEASYFHALEENQENAWVASITADYVGEEGSYIMWSGFYNSAGADELNFLNLAVVSSARPLNAKNILPFKYAMLLQISTPLSPLFTLSVATMYFPKVEGSYFGPSLSYSVSDNISLDLISQYFAFGNGFDPASAQVFIRGKWSF